MKFDPRYYQKESVDKLFEYFNRTDASHPLIDLPTASGKSLVQAMIAEKILNEYPDCRLLFLTHRKELIQQNFQELIQNIGIVDAGIYSAGLHSRDTHNQILFAGIQSVYKRAKELGKFNLIIIDECHLVSNKGFGMYRTFLNDMFELAPYCKVVGLTATPFRLDSGLLTEGKNKIFDEIIYRAPLKKLIDEGYICKLVGKTGIIKPDTSHVHKRGGEFIESELELVCDDMAIIRKAVSEIKELTQDRKHILVFCAGIKHAEHLADEMNIQGIPCGVIHSKISRDNVIEDFKNGKTKALVNVDILTTGFNFKGIDCICLLRPTMSAGLYYQMIGRGFRIHPDKENCLVLDYAGNILQHGPVDKIDIQTTGYDGETGVKTAAMKECPGCKEAVLAHVAVCPHCGYEWPVNVAEMSVNHDGEAAALAPLSQYQPPIEYDVESVFYYLHEKNDKISMRVSYGIGCLNSVSEWICVEHEGYAKQKAVEWLKDHVPEGYPIPDTVEECLELKDEFKKPIKIFVDYNQKFPRIISKLYEE
jgi:DNA repair protein RadD